MVAILVAMVIGARAVGMQPVQQQDAHSKNAIAAAKILRKAGSLNAKSIERLRDLGEDAFEPVLKTFLSRCHSIDANPELSGNLDERTRWLAGLLRKKDEPRRVSALKHALESADGKGAAQVWFIRALMDAGGWKVAEPYYNEMGKSFEGNQLLCEDERAADCDPKAEGKLLAVLNASSDQNSWQRREAYCFAAAMGKAGLKKVLALRKSSPIQAPADATEGEKIFAAALDSEFHWVPWDWAPIVLYGPPGIRQIPIPGKATMTWRPYSAINTDRATRLPKEPTYIFLGTPGRKSGKSLDDFIDWSPDRRSVEVWIRVVTGTLSGSTDVLVLRKFGSEWLPILKETMGVS